MKKLFTLSALVFGLSVAAQTSIQLTNFGNNTIVNPNSSVFLTTTANSTTNFTVDVKNTSNVTKKYWVKRYDVKLNTGADAFFCFASYCYGPFVEYSPNPITLTAGQSASQLGISNFQMLVMDLTEGPVVAHSLIKYTVFDSINPVDSVQFSAIYNNGVGISTLEKELSAFDVYPNPASETAFLRLQSNATFQTRLSIFNSLGELVSEKNVVITEGKNKIDLSLENLSSGLYFVNLRSGNANQTRRLIVK